MRRFYMAVDWNFQRSGIIGFVFLTALLLQSFFLPGGEARAVDLNMSFMSSWSDNPASDPNGNKLVAMMACLETYYEDIFEHELDEEFTVYFRYEESITSLAQYSSDQSQNGYPLSGLIRINPNVDWFIDPTPFDNSEYDVHQVLYRDLSESMQTSRFNGDVPDLLEVAYEGTLRSSAPAEAQDAYDLWSVVLHEMGHGLGMIGPYNGDDIGDSDYDFDDILVWGHDMAANCYSDTNRNHLKASALMDPGIGKNQRHLPAMIDILSMTDGAEWDVNTIDLKRKDFYSSNALANFNKKSNWAGNQMPGGQDDAFIRHGGNVTLSANADLWNLTVAGGSNLSMGSHQLITRGTTRVGNDPTDTATVETGIGNFAAKNLTIAAGSSVILGGGALYTVSCTVEQNATIRGTGTVSINDDFNLGGELRAQNGDLTIQAQPGYQPVVNLGYTAHAKAEAESGNLTFALPIDQTENASFKIYDGRTMTFNHPWTLADSGEIILSSNTAATKIAGAEVTVNGLLYVVGQHAETDCPVIVESGATVLFSNGRLTLSQETRIRAGVNLYGTGELVANAALLLDDDAQLHIDLTATDQITIGTTTGLATTEKSLQLESTAELVLDIGKNGMQQLVSDHLSAQAGADLGGATLRLNLLDDVELAIGDTFDLFDWGETPVNSFATILEPDGYTFDLNNLYTTGSITILTISPGIPGDANGDGVVDASDATILAGNWQAGPNASWEMGDFNGDGIVDASDATILAGNWQYGTSSGNTAIPEPSMGVLLGLLLLMIGGFAASRTKLFIPESVK